MSKYILSPNAKKSLRDIKTYSLEHFGDKQTQIYLDKIRERVRFVAEKPNRGKNRDEIKEGYFSIAAGSHMIYYKIQSSHIDIIDVLHQKMEPLLHLYED